MNSIAKTTKTLAPESAHKMYAIARQTLTDYPITVPSWLCERRAEVIAPAKASLFPLETGEAGLLIHRVANNAAGQASLSPSWLWLKEELV